MQSTQQVQTCDDEEAEQNAAAVSRGILVWKLGFEATEEILYVSFFGECSRGHDYFLY